MQLGYVRDEPSAADKKLARLQGVEPVPGLQSGVGSAEYRDICGGTGKFSSQPGMLVEMAQIFAACGREWIWQQDGARVHTLHPDTVKGKTMRALILQHAHRFVDDWPPNSPDLSPIENVWQRVEDVLWSTRTWHDLASFKSALVDVWKEVTGDKAYVKRVCTSFEKRRLQCIARKGKKTDY